MAIPISEPDQISDSWKAKITENIDFKYIRNQASFMGKPCTSCDICVEVNDILRHQFVGILSFLPENYLNFPAEKNKLVAFCAFRILIAIFLTFCHKIL